MKLKKAASKVNTQVHKRGLLTNVKTKASNLWTTIDKVGAAIHACFALKLGFAKGT